MRLLGFALEGVGYAWIVLLLAYVTVTYFSVLFTDGVWAFMETPSPFTFFNSLIFFAAAAPGAVVATLGRKLRERHR